MSTRKIFAIVLILFLVLCVVSNSQPAYAATQITVTYTQPGGIILAGQTFSVTVNLDVPADKPFTGGQFNLSWNPAVLSLTGVTNGTFFSTATCPVAVSVFPIPPTINNTTGTMTNYGLAGLGIPEGEGCTGNGVFVTLNFQAIATGRSSNLVSGVLLSNGYGQAYLVDEYSFPGFTQFVGEKLVVTNFNVQGVSAGSDNFTAKVTVANQGSVASIADSVALTTDGDSAPASTSGIVPVISAGGSTVVSVTGFSLAAGKGSSVITLKFADQTLTATYLKEYAVFIPTILRP